MTSDEFFRQCGGVQTVLSGSDPDDPASLIWDFGMRYAPVPLLSGDVHDVAPNTAGTWDGKTSVSLWQVFEKAIGTKLRAQYQPRGTCVGRGCSGAGNVLQASLIASGANLKYRPVSHAWCYAVAREKANQLRSWEDGAVGSYAAIGCKEKGVLAQDEAKDRSGKLDTNYYGAGSDDIAVQWAYYGAPRELLPIAADNPFKEVAICRNFQQAADVIASGGVVTVASSQGFTMERGSDGFCRPSGTWMHQMYFAAVIVTASGKRGLGCGQSWGDNTPSGPLLPGCPDYVFGVDETTVNRMLAQNDSVAVSAFEGWKGRTLEWMFL